nr:transglutaminase-like domain-containing protein [Clostridia bacterium]
PDKKAAADVMRPFFDSPDTTIPPHIRTIYRTFELDTMQTEMAVATIIEDAMQPRYKAFLESLSNKMFRMLGLRALPTMEEKDRVKEIIKDIIQKVADGNLHPQQAFGLCMSMKYKPPVEPPAADSAATDSDNVAAVADSAKAVTSADSTVRDSSAVPASASIAATAAGVSAASALIAPVLLGAALCALLVLSARAPWGKLVPPALLILALLFTLLFRGSITEGACLLWNAWRAALTAATGRLYLGVATGAAPADTSMRLLLLTAAIVLSVCAVALRRACPRLASALCLLLAVALSLLPGLKGVGLRIALLLAVGLALLLTPDEATGGALPARWLPFGIALVCFALLLLAVRCFAPVRDGSAFAALRRGAVEAVHSRLYEPEPQPLPEGDLTRAGRKPDGGATRLTVSMTQPESLYLRGFVGDTFTGAAWLPVSNAALAADADLLYWLHRSGFYPQTQASRAAALLDGAEELNSISVNNLSACGAYIYAPYGLTQADGLTYLSMNDLNASGIKNTDRALRRYRYAAVYKAPDRTEEWAEVLGAPGSAELDAYRAEEAGYRDFVLAHDLEIPESARRLLAPLLDACRESGGAEPMTPSEAVACVDRFLEQYLTYREDVPAMGASDDFLAYTLNTLQGGWDVHYATLAVLALRYYGVPARYAEGYLVSAQQASEAAGQWILLDDGSASAWAEVYQEGIGWLPLRQTLGNESASSPADPSKEPDENSPVGTKTGENEEPNDAEPDTPEEKQDVVPNETEGPVPETHNSSQTKLPSRRIALLWLLPILLLLLLLAGTYLRRRRILLRRERLFSQPDTAQAVSCLYAYVLRLLEPLAIAPEKGRLLELPPLLAEKLTPAYAARFSRMTELNYRALFSAKPLPDTAREDMSALRGETVAELNRGCGAWKRLRLKWLRCLY